jgi:hypothetical protein
VNAVFHITHVTNLDSILREGGLCCDNRRNRQSLACTGIAYEHIKARRANRKVPVCRGGTLADYVPFYFAPRSPMLYTINRGNVPNYADGQGPVVYLVASAEQIDAGGLPFAFTDGHADMGYSEFFDDLSKLDEVDWEIMKATYWNDTADDGDRKRRRQAEFLVHDFLPWRYVDEISVIDASMAQRVQTAMSALSRAPRVTVRRDWYY